MIFYNLIISNYLYQLVLNKYKGFYGIKYFGIFINSGLKPYENIIDWSLG